MFARLLLALIMFATSAACILVFTRAARWRQMLVDMESECDIARDMVMMHATMARSQMSELQERLTTKHEKHDAEIMGSLIKQAVPVVTMFFQKETSLIKWGFAGFNLVRSAVEIFSRKEKN